MTPRMLRGVASALPSGVICTRDAARHSICAPSLFVKAFVLKLFVVVDLVTAHMREVLTHRRRPVLRLAVALRLTVSSDIAPSGIDGGQCECLERTLSCLTMPSPAGRSPSVRSHMISGTDWLGRNMQRRACTHDHGHLLQQQSVLALNLHIALY